MRCRKVEKLLPAYVDGELSERVSARVEQHLATCSHCAALLELHRGVLTQWEGLPAVAPERNLWPEIVARITASPKPRRSRLSELWQPVFGLPAPVVGVALFLLAVGLGLFSYRFTHTSPRQVERVAEASQPVQPNTSPAYSDAPQIFEAAATILGETRNPTADKLLPTKAELVGQAVLQLQSDPFLGKELKPLLDDVEIALTELSAAGSPSSQTTLRDVQKLVREKDLLVRLSVAKAVLSALTEANDMPPEILAAYLQPPK
ncbi:MAG: hypothetical protein GXO73_03740 [Calditrichaeota bacterium]|nr:hypothetical protein [Calditrichota bacterium]